LERPRREQAASDFFMSASTPSPPNPPLEGEGFRAAARP
jgi:hypothetical protein